MPAVQPAEVVCGDLSYEKSLAPHSEPDKISQVLMYIDDELLDANKSDNVKLRCDVSPASNKQRNAQALQPPAFDLF